MSSEEAVVTIREATVRAGVGAQKVHRDIQEGRLKAFKIGWQWVIKEKNFVDYLLEIEKDSNKS